MENIAQAFQNRMVSELNKFFDDKVLKMLLSDISPIIKLENLKTMNCIVDYKFKDVPSGVANDLYWHADLTIWAIDGKVLHFEGLVEKKKKVSRADAARLYVEYLLHGVYKTHNQVKDEPLPVQTGIKIKPLLDVIERFFVTMIKAGEHGNYFECNSISQLIGNLSKRIVVHPECFYFQVLNNEVYISVYNSTLLWSLNIDSKDDLISKDLAFALPKSEVNRLMRFATEASVITGEQFNFYEQYSSEVVDDVLQVCEKGRPTIFHIPGYRMSGTKLDTDPKYWTFLISEDRKFVDHLFAHIKIASPNDEMWRYETIGTFIHRTWRLVATSYMYISSVKDCTTAVIPVAANKNCSAPEIKSYDSEIPPPPTKVESATVGSKYWCKEHKCDRRNNIVHTISIKGHMIFFEKDKDAMNLFHFSIPCKCVSAPIDLENFSGYIKEPLADLGEKLSLKYSFSDRVFMLYLLNCFPEWWTREYLGDLLVSFEEAREFWNDDNEFRTVVLNHPRLKERLGMTPFSMNFITRNFQKFSAYMYRSGWTDQEILDKASKNPNTTLFSFFLWIALSIGGFTLLGMLPGAFIAQPLAVAITVYKYVTGDTGVFWATFKRTKNRGRERTLYFVFVVLGLNIIILSYFAFKRLFTTVRDSIEKTKLVNQVDGPSVFTAKASSGFLYLFKGTVGMVCRILQVAGKKLPSNWRMLEKDFKTCADDLLNLIRGYQLLVGDKIFMERMSDMVNQAGEDGNTFDNGVQSESDDDVTKKDDLSANLDMIADEKWVLTREEVTRFISDNKYIIMAIIGGSLVVSAVIYYLLKERKEEDDQVYNEGWRRKQYDRFLKSDYGDYVTKTDPRSAETKALTDQCMHRLLMKKVPVEHFKVSNVKSTSDVTSLLNYGEVIVRLGGHERRFTPTASTADSLRKYITQAAEVARAFDRPLLMHVRKDKDQGEGEWFSFRPMKSESLQVEDDDIDNIAGASNLKLTDDERKLVKTCASINDGLTRVVLLRGLDCSKIENNGLVDGGYLTNALQNEAMLGSQKMRLGDVLSSVYVLYNSYYKTRSLGLFVRGHLYTVAHGIVDKDLTTKNPGTLGKCVRDENFYLDAGKFTIKRLDVPCDVAILLYKSEAPKQCHLNDEVGDYVGIGFIVSKRGPIDAPIPFIGMGMLWKSRTYLMHTIPTEDGDSGAPIFTAIGHLVGIHKGHISNLNIGVPIDCFLDAQVRPQFAKLLDLKFAKNQALGESIGNKLNFDYLPKRCVPKVLPVPPDNIVPLEYREAHNNGNCRIIGSVVQKTRKYDKFSISELYTTYCNNFGLPPKLSESEWGIAQPSLASIRKDFFKYCSKRNFPYDYTRFRLALSLYEEWFKKTYPSKIPTMGVIEAVESFEADKASGYPLNQVYATKGQYRDAEMLSFYVFFELIYNGENPTVIFEEFGKEELRLAVKLIEDKIRSVNSAPYMVVVTERMLFGNLLEIVAHQPFQHSNTTSGFSPYYGGWDQLVRFMKSKRYSYDKMDFVKWDSSVQLFIAVPMLFIWFDQLDADEKHHKLFDWYVRNVWFECICLLPILDLGDGTTLCLLIIIFRGMKSGLLITFLGNCHINIIRHIYCMWTYNEKIEVRELILGENKDPISACGDDFGFGSDILIDIDDYKERNRELGLELEDIRVTEGYEFEFAGAETVVFGSTFVPAYNQERLLFNVAVVKKNMLPWQYTNKLDALVRVGCFCNSDEVNKIIQYRNFLVNSLLNVDPEVRKHSPSYVNLKEARQNFLVINEVAALNLLEPHKFGIELTSVDPDIDLSSIIMRYHGNYCGPNWSAGKHQESVIDPTVPAVDEFDQTCLEHDKAFAQYREGDIDFKALEEANKLFVNQNWFQGVKRTLAALAVKYGGLEMARKRGSKKAKATIKRIEKRVARKLVATQGSTIGQRLPRALRRRRGARPINRRRRVMNFKSGPAYVAKQNKISRNRYTLKQGPDSATMTGKFFITNISSGASGYKAGDIIYSNSINPFNFGQSDVEYEANRWERFLFKDFTLHYETQAPTSTPGGIVLYADYDPSDTIPQGQSGIYQALNSRVSTAGAVWKNHSISVKKKPLQTWYYCQENISDNDSSFQRFTEQGTMTMLAETDIPANTTMGCLLVSFTVMFQGRHLDPAATITNASTLQASASIDDVHPLGFTGGVSSPLNDNTFYDNGNVSSISPYYFKGAPGTYKVVLAYKGSGMTCTAITFASFINCTMSNDTVVYSSTAILLYLNLNVITSPCRFQFNPSAGSIVGATGGKITIYRVRSAIFKSPKTIREDDQDKRIADLEAKLTQLLQESSNYEQPPAKSLSGIATPKITTF